MAQSAVYYCMIYRQDLDSRVMYAIYKPINSKLK